MENKRTVEEYLEGFRQGDHERVLATLTDDAVWDIPGVFHLTGKEAFDQEIENPAFQGHPEIAISRMTEARDVVVAEGTARTQKRTGEIMHLAFCDVFELRGGKIARLVSYLMEVKS